MYNLKECSSSVGQKNVYLWLCFQYPIRPAKNEQKKNSIKGNKQNIKANWINGKFESRQNENEEIAIKI